MHPAKHYLIVIVAASLALCGTTRAADADKDAKPLRAGIIGLDTSHVIAFTKLFNDPKAEGDLAAIKVVAAFPGGSQDIASSRDRVVGYTSDLKAMGVEIVDTIPALLEKVDVVLLESVDGRPHLEQVRPVFAAGKPVFIDKPLAGTLADAIAIDALAKKHNAVWFSSSALRFCTNIPTMRTSEQVGQVTGCDAWSPCSIEPTHPDLFWYGIHGVEILYTIMGPGCESVTRARTDTAEVVTGTWKDGRVGIFRGIKKGKQDYGAMVYGTKGNLASGGYDSYKGLVQQIAIFFKSHKPPVNAEDTLEIMAFMEAADESKRQGGAPVKLESVIAKAREQAKARVGD
ncbi:MAG: Gfo/Idh/MocA family oxidoreductase [Tepidisphaeraceae bacterium]|jgi:predicted dehydrogenase